MTAELFMTFEKDIDKITEDNIYRFGRYDLSTVDGIMDFIQDIHSGISVVKLSNDISSRYFFKTHGGEWKEFTNNILEKYIKKILKTT